MPVLVGRGARLARGAKIETKFHFATSRDVARTSERWSSFASGAISYTRNTGDKNRRGTSLEG